MGRRKIEIQPLTDDRNRTVTFVKRKAGLFKKAHELSVLCQVDLAVIIVGNNNRVYEYSSVDTKELMNAYSKVKRPQESKSPENYGNYKKRKRLHENTSLGVMDDDEIDDNDSEFDSDSLPAKKKQRDDDRFLRRSDASVENSTTTHTPAGSVSSLNPSYKPASNSDDFDSLHSKLNSESSINRSGSQRPVLRVQIPVEAKTSNNDSGKTLTALDSKYLSASPDYANVESQEQSNLGPNSGKFINRRPITSLRLSAVSKSQTSSPASPTAPQLPAGGVSSYMGNLPSNYSSQYMNSAILPTPILNQVFNQQYEHDGERYETNNQNNTNQSTNHNVNNTNSNNSTNTTQSHVHPINTPSTKNGRPKSQGAGNGEQTPISGLPSRYMNDIFPSPSTFYASQDWPNSGMTPVHNNYFVPIVAPNGPLAHIASRHTQHAQQANHVHAGSGSKPEALPSPLQFMAPFSSTLPPPVNNGSLNNKKK